MAYATLDELKGYVGIPVLDDVDDDTLQLALDSASAQVDHYCDRTFTADADPTVRTYDVTDMWHLDVHPISTATGLVVKTDDNNDGVYETTWTLGTDYRLEPANASATGEPWTRLTSLGTRWFPRLRYRQGVQVTARFGWPGGSAPAPVKQATLILALKIWKRKDAAFGVAGSAEFGSEMRILAGDMDAERLLKPYRRNWWVA